ncbi:hypothetical protein APF79_14310 [bacterium BRH_c32]|nr:MAG: hypothetical protein APF79_14310 [bacterium BRH_c32]
MLGILRIKLSHRDKYDLNELLVELAAIQNTVRNISHNFTKSQINSLGFINSVKAIVDDFITNTNIPGKFEFSLDEKEIDLVLSEEIKNLLLNCIQEGLNNILKHSKAKLFLITITTHENLIDLSIADDGIGIKRSFDNIKLTENSGIGLFRIKERVQNFSGSFDIVESDEFSTLLFITLPIGINNGKN